MTGSYLSMDYLGGREQWSSRVQSGGFDWYNNGYRGYLEIDT